MSRLFAIGDIHGCAEEVDVLLEHLAPGHGDKVVFVGDYVDRGPGSRAVLDRLISLSAGSAAEWVFLKGNHEDMFLSYLGLDGAHGSVFLRNGGRATLASYGLAADREPRELAAALPVDHLDFLRSLRLYEIDGPFLFVHAGVSPILPLDRQEGDDLLWIREEFIRHRHRLPYTIVFGHTPHREVLWHLPYKIGLDTGCVYGNKLSCLELRGGVLRQVRKGSREVTIVRDTPELAAVAEIAARTPAVDLV